MLSLMFCCRETKLNKKIFLAEFKQGLKNHQNNNFNFEGYFGNRNLKFSLSLFISKIDQKNTNWNTSNFIPRQQNSDAFLLCNYD